MTEQLPLFELATEPLDETEDVLPAPNHLTNIAALRELAKHQDHIPVMSWDQIREEYGWTPEQFAQADTTTMSPIEEENDEDHHAGEVGNL